jgi:uncharacterized protein (DUF736 family)
MAYTQNDMSGSLFRNERKEKDNHPDYNGSCVIHGEEMWISAWLKTGKDGKKFMSFSFKPKQERQAAAREQSHQGGDTDEGMGDQDIPF